MPIELSSDFYFLFLEQYHLLNSKFNLNSQRIVNFRVNQGMNIYLYDKEFKILYYTSKSLNQINSELGIHYKTCINCIKNGNLFLNFFNISDKKIEEVTKTNLNLDDLIKLISEKKKLFLIKSFKEKNSMRTHYIN